MEQKEILQKLGLDTLPGPRYQVTDPHHIPSGSQLLNFKKALKLVDAIETAAFGRYIPDTLIVDQSLDSRAFSAAHSRAIMIRTDLPIPGGPKVFRSTGIGAEPNTHTHYLWLAQELKRHVDELGATAISPPLIFRTSGHDDTAPLLGAVFKLDLRPKDGQTAEDMGANWALLGPRAPQVHLDEDESLEDVK